MNTHNPTRTGVQIEAAVQPWTLWVLACVFMNYDLGAGLYTTQLLLFICFLIWLFRLVYFADDRLGWALFSMLTFLAWSVLVHRSGNNGRFAPELAKVALLYFSPFVLRDLNIASAFDRITLVVPVSIGMLTAYTRFFGNWNFYDPLLGRFGVQSLGSPNTLAYVLAFSMLMIHHQLSRRPLLGRKILLLATFLVLLAVLIATQSRGGLVIYVAGLLAYLDKRWRILLLSALAVVTVIMLMAPSTSDVSRMNVIMEAQVGGGTGRTFIWAMLFADLLQTPIRILIGNGPGAIDLYLFGLYHIESAHNFVIETVYSYGLIGLAPLAWIMTSIRPRDGAAQRFSIRNALWLGLLVSLFLDSYPPTAQILWFTPLLITLILPPRHDRSPHRAGSAHPGALKKWILTAIRPSSGASPPGLACKGGSE